MTKNSIKELILYYDELNKEIDHLKSFDLHNSHLSTVDVACVIIFGIPLMAGIFTAVVSTFTETIITPFLSSALIISVIFGVGQFISYQEQKTEILDILKRNHYINKNIAPKTFCLTTFMKLLKSEIDRIYKELIDQEIIKNLLGFIEEKGEKLTDATVQDVLNISAELKHKEIEKRSFKQRIQKEKRQFEDIFYESPQIKKEPSKEKKLIIQQTE